MKKYSYQFHYNFSENRVVDGRELEGLGWSKVTGENKMHTHGVIRNDSSYKGDLRPIAEAIKTAHEKAYSVHGVQTTFSYEFNQNADPSKQFVYMLSNWSYYELQTKIKYKAEKAGIELIIG